MKLTQILAATALAVTIVTASAQAQTPETAPESAPAKHADRPCSNPELSKTETIRLTNVTQQNDANEILVALRNILYPACKMFLVAGQNAIVVQASPDQLALAHQLVTELDRPRKTYRLTFTLTDSDGGKKLGSQHFSLDAVAGQDTFLKQGTKIPVITGNFSAADSKTGAGVQTQVTYLDMGMNIDVTVSPVAHGAVLKSKVEQSSVDPATASNQDPIVRQSVISGVSAATFDKPLQLGSLDIPNTTHHLDIEVLVEELP